MCEVWGKTIKKMEKGNKWGRDLLLELLFGTEERHETHTFVLKGTSLT